MIMGIDLVKNVGELDELPVIYQSLNNFQPELTAFDRLWTKKAGNFGQD